MLQLGDPVGVICLNGQLLAQCVASCLQKLQVLAQLLIMLAEPVKIGVDTRQSARAAVAKLYYLFSCGCDAETVKTKMEADLRGELTEA